MKNPNGMEMCFDRFSLVPKDESHSKSDRRNHVAKR